MSTLHRIITVLRHHGLVTQDSHSKKYRLGYGAIDLGRRAASGFSIRQIAVPFMRGLADQTGETVVLTVVNDTRDRAVCIERIESQHDLRLHLEVGGQSFLHAGASSKALLAYFTPDEVAGLVRSVGLPPLAPNTVRDLGALEEALSVVREQGYAFSKEETDVGAWGVAAPILDPEGRAIAAIGLAAPTSRYSVDAERRFVAAIKQAGRDIADELGVPVRK